MKRIVSTLIFLALIPFFAGAQTEWKEGKKTYSATIDNDLTINILGKKGKVKYHRELTRYTMENNPGELTISLPLEVVSIGGDRQYLHFGYYNGDTEYVEALYLPKEDILYQVMFYGKPLREGTAGKEAASAAGMSIGKTIEGQSPEDLLEDTQLTAELLWLKDRLANNTMLVRLSDQDYLTDKSIDWWLENNPLGGSKIKFSFVSEDSSIAQSFKKARKERGKNCSAAFFDIRGYTVVCISKSGVLSLVWCEPVCKNKRTDKFLNSIYFESDGTTLDLFYYKGKTTSKNKISTVSGAIYRFN